MTKLRKKLLSGLLMIAALALATATAAQARDPYRAPSPHKRWADANGYFFFPANYMDDSYVYDPSGVPRTRVRHWHHHKAVRYR
jgi:hypothetical protein